MRRTKTFNEDVSVKLGNPRFAQSFFMTLMEDEDGLSVDEALRTVIEIVGIKRFSELCGVKGPNIHRFLKKKVTLKPESLDQLLKPFRLKTKIIVERAS